MALGQGYPALANSTERGQISALDTKIMEIDRRLAELNSAIGGNFKSMATVFSTKEKPLDMGAARDSRFQLSERAKEERRQLEQQKASLSRQRQGMEGGISSRRLAQAGATVAKLPLPDQQLFNEIKNHPERGQELLQQAQQSILQGIQGGGSAESVIQAAVHLRSVAALMDAVSGQGTYAVGKGSLKDDKTGALIGGEEAGALGEAETMAFDFIKQTVPKFLVASGAVQLPPAADVARSRFQPIDAGDTGQAELGGQIQDAMRREANPTGAEPIPAPLPGRAPGTDAAQAAGAQIPGPPTQGQGLADVLQSFAGRGGPAPDPGAGRQFVFTGHQGEIQGGTAPAGAPNPFAQMQRDPALEQRIMANTLQPQRQFNPLPLSPQNVNPASAEQGGPLVPPGPVTGPPLPEVSRPSGIAAASGVQRPSGLGLASGIGNTLPPQAPPPQQDPIATRLAEYVQGGGDPAAFALELLQRGIDPGAYGLSVSPPPSPTPGY